MKNEVTIFTGQSFVDMHREQVLKLLAEAHAELIAMVKRDPDMQRKIILVWRFEQYRRQEQGITDMNVKKKE